MKSYIRCSQCNSELLKNAVVCSKCGNQVRPGDHKDHDWRQQVRETVERHKEKKKQKQSRTDDDARQLTIFPEGPEETQQGEQVRNRHAEIRARVENKLSKGTLRRKHTSVDKTLALPPDVSETEDVVLAQSGEEPQQLPLDDRELKTGQPQEFDVLKSDLDVVTENSTDQSSVEPGFSFGLASPAERILSGFIDVAFVSLIQLTLFYLTTHAVGREITVLPVFVLVALGFVGTIFMSGYFIFFWSLSGQTLGKLLTGNRIVDSSGKQEPLGIRCACLRLFGTLVSVLILGFGFLGLWTDAQRRGWHDRISGTCVVRC